MKYRKFKKGFTLIELVVVIAVIGILAGVSVATYFGVTNSAKESNDISLTKQMNDLLLLESVAEGANKTTYDAIIDLQENGIDITKLTPTKEGYEFAFDISQDKFFLLNGDKIVAPTDVTLSTNKTDIYKFIGEGEKLSEEYSNYLKDDYLSSGSETICTGLDVGNHKLDVVSLKSDFLTNANLRLDTKELIIEAPKATINFYGKANKTTVKSVDEKESLHIYGEILSLDVTTGHIVVEDGGTVNSIRDTASDSNFSKVTVDIKQKGTVGAVISENQDIIVSYKKPVSPDVVSPSNIESGFSGGIGTDSSPYLISNIDEWKILAGSDSRTSTNGYHFKVVNDLDFSLMNSSNDFKLNYPVYNFKGAIDFSGKTLYGMTPYSNAIFPLFYYSNNNADVDIKINNLDFYPKDYGTLVYFPGNGMTSQKVEYSNVNIKGKFLAKDNNAFTPFMYYNGSFAKKGSYTNMINCNNYADISFNSSTAGIFAGYGPGKNGTDGPMFNFKNCNNYGTVINTSGVVGMLISNCSGDYFKDVNSLKIENCHNYGIITGNEGANLISGSLSNDMLLATNELIQNGTYTIKNDEGGFCAKVATEKLSVSNGKIKLSTVTNAVKYVINFRSAFKGGLGAITSVQFKVSADEYSKIELLDYDFIVGEESLDVAGLEPILNDQGQIYLKNNKYIMSNDFIAKNKKYITTQPVLSIVAYDGEDNILKSYIHRF